MGINTALWYSDTEIPSTTNRGAEATSTSFLPTPQAELLLCRQEKP